MNQKFLPQISKLTLVFVILLGTLQAHCQLGKDGDATISTTVSSNPVATNLTVNAAQGSNQLTVRSAAQIITGDLLMIYQAQGATVQTATNDENWGAITDMGNAGVYEFVEVQAVNGNTITLQSTLDRNYFAAHTVGTRTIDNLVQVIKVPRYENLTIGANGTLTANNWNGATGGIVAIEVNQTLSIEGTIDVSERGFRGGQVEEVNSINAHVPGFRSNDKADGGMKGEGIAGFDEAYQAMGGLYGRGPVANGGGGGNGHNAGGGGGANAFNSMDEAWSGLGNPDPAFDPYWAVESSFGNATPRPGGIAGHTSSGGGRGGYTWSNQDLDPIVGTSSSAWGQWGDDTRDNLGGYGGRPLTAAAGRAFLGGGGGAGSHDNGHTQPGGAGGGLVIILNNGKVVGAGKILANGADGGNDIPALDGNNSADAPSGAGAGGSVLIKSTWGVDTQIDIEVIGGIGGSQLFPFAEAEGAGGGGGAGYIAEFNTLSSNAPSMDMTGGKAGITITEQAQIREKFPVNGATDGGGGSQDEFPFHPVVVTCPDLPVELNVSNEAQELIGSNIKWYDRPSGGQPLPGTGSPWTSPIIAGMDRDTFYFSSSTNGLDTRFPIIVQPEVLQSGEIDISANHSMCQGDTVVIYTGIYGPGNWTPDIGLSLRSDSVLASPDTTTTYTLEPMTSGCGLDIVGTVEVEVLPTPQLITEDVTVCYGSPATLRVQSDAAFFNWFPRMGLSDVDGPSAISTSLESSSYQVVATSANGCVDSGLVNLTVLPLPDFKVEDAKVCQGTAAELTVSGNYEFLWTGINLDQDVAGNTLIVAPEQTSTYSVRALDSNQCINQASVSVSVGLPADPDRSDDVEICPETRAEIFATGGEFTVWETGDTSTAIMVAPTQSRYYRAQIHNEGCITTDSVLVEIIGVDATLYAPNAYTPNGDGKNDQFMVTYSEPDLVFDFEGLIYNRWGDLVYAWNDIGTGWDGTYKNEISKSDVYSYKVRISDQCHQRTELIGKVSLVH